MAIGGINNSSGFSIGGKPLGVQLGQKSATELFGGGNSVDNIFAANVTGSRSIQVSPTRIAVKGLQDEIDRTLGYRTNLSTAEKQKLADLQTKITKIESLQQARLLTTAELGERAALFLESYKILGRQYSDVSNDQFVQDQSAALSKLLATKPKGSDGKLLAILLKVKDNLNADLSGRGDSVNETLNRRLISVSKRIASLTAARPVSRLSVAERREHDNLVTAINDHVGFELELTSAKKLKIERLQATIATISAGGTNTLA